MALPASVPFSRVRAAFNPETQLYVDFNSRFLRIFVFRRWKLHGCADTYIPLSLLALDLLFIQIESWSIIHYLITRKIHESNAITERVTGFYINLASRLACATCARRWARSEFCAPWAPFFEPWVLWIGGATPVCESAIGVISDAKPGMRML